MFHVAVFLIAFIIALPAHAQTAHLEAELQALLAQLQSLQAQLQVNSAPAGALPTQGGAQCPVLSRALRLGMSGADVSALQAFLATDRAVYPDAVVSGYFGPLTQAAVQRFQTKHGIVSNGSPDTTGFGAVGPATRSTIAAACRSQPVPAALQSVGARTCALDGITLMHGETRTFYWDSVVPFGGHCDGAPRTCSNGTLTGPNEYRFTACRAATSPDRCELDGKILEHGSSDSFYTKREVLFGQNCSAFRATRTCDNGYMKGDRDYRYATCTSAGAKSCTVVATVLGKVATTTVVHGASADFWSAESVAYTSTCDAIKLRRTCNDGVLSGSSSFIYPRCEVIPERACTLDGITVAGGASHTFYTARTNADCRDIDQVRRCTNGVLSGSGNYKFAYCAPSGRRYCVLDGVYVAHNASLTFYSTRNAAFGSDCSQFDQSRTCKDGTLDGSASYAYASCQNATGSSCVVDGVTVSHGGKATFYSTRTAPSGDTCGMYGQERTCVNGNLSGSSSFQYKSCSASTSDRGAQNQVATALTALEALLKDALLQLDSWL